MMENKEGFSYTYSAKEQEEIKNIRKKYVNIEENKKEYKEEDKIEVIRRMDKRVTYKAIFNSILVGVIGAIVLGISISLVFTELGEILGSYILTISISTIVGMLGMFFIYLAYPVYHKRLKEERKKISSEIIKLTDELIK